MTAKEEWEFFKEVPTSLLPESEEISLLLVDGSGKGPNAQED